MKRRGSYLSGAARSELAERAERRRRSPGFERYPRHPTERALDGAMRSWAAVDGPCGVAPLASVGSPTQPQARPA